MSKEAYLVDAPAANRRSSRRMAANAIRVSLVCTRRS